jgi:hypothetical protein
MFAGLDRGTTPFTKLSTRLATKPARFKLAVTLGFFIATVGFCSAGPGARVLFAQESIWGSLSSLFGQPPAQRVAPQATSAPRLEGGVRVATRHSSRRHFVWHISTRRVLAARQAPRQALCVRLCDGYSFPMGAYHGDGDHGAQDSLCQSSCPDAATALYLLPTGSDKIADATQVGTGRNYSELPDAFHYTTVLDDACTCHKAGSRSNTMSLLRDLTLKRGDAVMTTGGFKVFHGGRSFPFHREDFVALAHSHDVRKTDRAIIGAIERASLKAPVSLTPGNDVLFSQDVPVSRRPLRTSRAARWMRQASRS